MVAFIGAVICIIAAVHTGSSKAAAAQRQPVADNHSLYPDAVAQTPAAVGGFVPRPGSLGALHGSETPDSEAPTFNVGLGGLEGVSGLTGHDPAVSRLICTPVPAGRCNTRNFQQQADDPSLYAGEDWGYLRTTEEELRNTVLQQKDQILTDQSTIKELTGKLSECEKGLGGRNSSPDRRGNAAALAGGKGAEGEAHLERMMVRDSADSAPDRVHLLTVGNVDELEQAITQLKDRIDRLETDIGPFSHNRTDSKSSEASEEGGQERSAYLGRSTGSDKPWEVEDLEEGLERKVELLEKERKALRLEAEKHRQEVDHGISKLQQRILGLEEEHSFPEGFRLSFPAQTNYMFALMRHAIPKLRAFTACLWLRPAGVGIGTPLSYAVPEQPNELVLLQGMHTPIELLINDKVVKLPLNLSQGNWQHVCVSWTQKGGAWLAYQGGKLRGEGHGLAPGHHIRPGGELVLGQEQDSLGGDFDSTQALVGELSQVGLWDRVLSSAQVASLARCNRVTQGIVVPWDENRIDVYGGTTKDLGEPCSKHNKSSQ
ncbi:neuronal pentraxin-2-like [Girardinichthys multiradiatus]|uniref:neuronal pentraxin-2-like n=1 Tax=Girardinichthys multiradiatus TaxID=208333 RepID=UPI001FAD7D1C|nr:neuronal pentraxin-2-like [Girardinichthys multiradiatus]